MNLAPPPTFETERLLIRPIRHSDRESIFKWVVKPEVAEMVTWEPYTDIDQLDEFINGYVADHYKENVWDPMAITVKGKSDVIGFVGAFIISKRWKTLELGYVLDSDHWGKGIMPEAVYGLVQELFSKTDVHRIQVGIKDGNTKSKRVLEKLGFIYEGTIRGKIYEKGEYWNCPLYAILRGEELIPPSL